MSTKKSIPLRWKITAIILPIALIPLLLIAFFTSMKVNGALLQYNNNLYTSYLDQIADNLDARIVKQTIHLSDITSTDIYNKLLRTKPFSNELDELFYSTKLKKNSFVSDESSVFTRDETVIDGDIFIIEPGKKSALTGQPFSITCISDRINYLVDFNNLVHDPLYREIIADPALKMVFGGFKESVIIDTLQQSKQVLLFPVNRKGTKHPGQLLLLVFGSDFLNKFYTIYPQLGSGFFYVLDRNNTILFQNHHTKPQTDNSILETLTTQKQIVVTARNDQPDSRPDKLNMTEIISHDNQRFLLVLRHAAKTGATLVYFHPLADIYSPLSRFFQIFTLLVLILIAMIIAISVFLSKIVTRPLGRLHEAAEQITAGNLAFKFSVLKTGDEIELLSIAFSEMVTEIRDYTENLEHKVIERTLDLEQANRQAVQFFVSLAHETKTPLTLIRNYLDSYMAKVKLTEDLTIIKRNIDKLIHDMVNFLDAEKLKNGHNVYQHNTIINISSMLSQLIVLFKEVAGNKTITLNQTIDKLIYVRADRSAVERIINNLIDNAIKYSTENSNISVILRGDKESIILTVEDTGSGIPEDDIDSIFLPFQRSRYNEKQGQGVGMGLFITREIVMSLKGTINVESKMGQGSKFTVIIPRYYPDPTDTVEDVQVEGAVNTIPVLNLVTGSKFDPGKQSILIVEDNDDMRSYLFNQLSKQYNVFSAGNGREALNKLRDIPKPDMILSDIMMDEMDGYQLREILEKDNLYNDIPSIFITAKSTMPEKVEGLEHGVIDYISKPFAMDELTAKISAILSTINKQKLSGMQQAIQAITTKMDDKESIQHNKLEQFQKRCQQHQLTDRQIQIVKLLSEGYEYKEIADKLGIAVKTVGSHIQTLYDKTEVHNKIDLVNLFFK